jgi:hypothetical protein
MGTGVLKYWCRRWRQFPNSLMPQYLNPNPLFLQQLNNSSRPAAFLVGKSGIFDLIWKAGIKPEGHAEAWITTIPLTEIIAAADTVHQAAANSHG